MRDFLSDQFDRRPYRSVAVLLFLLVSFTYLPAALFSLSTNPLVFNSGLTVGGRPGFIPGLPTIDPNAGTTTQALGKLSAEDWIHGRIPWWNPYSGIGLPLAAEMQCSSLFLPFILLLLFSKGVLYLRIAMQILAGIATFALLRQMRFVTSATLFGSILYAFNGTFSWFQHASILPLPFLPLLLLGIERSFDRAKGHRAGGWTLISLALAGSLYAGFPETAYLNGLLAVPWVLVRLRGLASSERLRFLGKNILGCVLGLLLSVPALLPFFEYLKHSVVVHGDLRNAALPISSFLQLLLPYSMGPLEGFLAADPNNELIADWGNIGGYFGVAALFLSILALWSGRRERVLRIVLGIWTVLTVSRTIGLPGVGSIFHLIPGMDLVAIYRYGTPSCEMAVAILIAFTVEDWQAGRLKEKTKILLALAASAGVVGLGFWLSAPLLHRLWLGDVRSHAWLIYSAAGAVIVLPASFMVCSRPATRPATLALGVIVIGESLVLFTLPSLAGLRHAALDLGPVQFLQQHLGLQRYYSLGRIHQNYGAYYKVASLNYEMLPLADTWAEHVLTSLDPGASGITFSGDFPPPQAEREAAVLKHLAAFEDAGVKYIVTTGGNPFLNKVELPHMPNGNIAINLNERDRISGLLPPLSDAGTVDTVGANIGTNQGKASGTLEVQLCSAATCVVGQEPLLHAIDNATIYIPLAQQMKVAAGEQLRFTLTHKNGSFPVAVWVYPPVAGGLSSKLSDGHTLPMQPVFTVVYSGTETLPATVYQSSTTRIFELPKPAPYFDVVNGTCTVTPQSRDSVRLNCRTPAKLIRRELSYPGWSASINGGPEKQVQAHTVFQALDVPAGDSQITFRYAPTGIGWGYAAFVIGVLGLLTRLKRRT